MNIGGKQVMSGILVNCFHDSNNIAKNCDKLLHRSSRGEGICIKEVAMTWNVCLATTQQVGVIAFTP